MAINHVTNGQFWSTGTNVQQSTVRNPSYQIGSTYPSTSTTYLPNVTLSPGWQIIQPQPYVVYPNTSGLTVECLSTDELVKAQQEMFVEPRDHAFAGTFGPGLDTGCTVCHALNVHRFDPGKHMYVVQEEQDFFELLAA